MQDHILVVDDESAVCDLVCSQIRGLAGATIPLPARIVALADSYDALTSDRPYKKALIHGGAVQKIAVDRGSHFDPGVVDAFLEIHDDLLNIRQQINSADLEEGDWARSRSGGIQ